MDVIEMYDPGFATGVAGGSSMAGAGGGGQGGSGTSNAGAGGSGAPTGGSGGSGTAGSGSTGSGEYCNAPETVLGPACGIGSGCHGADSRIGDFGESEAAARALIDVETVNGCGSYIDSANPAQSQILVKLGDDIPGTCGAQMPFLNDPLPQAEIDCVTDWLSQF